MNALPPPTPWSKTYRFSMLTALLSVISGSLVLTGHMLDITPLKYFLPGETQMMPITALCFIFSGASLAISPSSPRLLIVQGARTAKYTATLFATLSALLALASLSTFILANHTSGGPIQPIPSHETAALLWSLGMSPKSSICFTLLSVTLALQTLLEKNAKAIFVSIFFSIVVTSLATASLFTFFSPAPAILGWSNLRVMSGDSAVLFFMLGLATLLLGCRQKSFEWALGRMATAGFIASMILLFFIGLIASRAQQAVSEANQELASSEIAYAKSASVFGALAKLQTSVLNFLLTNDLRFLNNGLAESDRVRILLDELSQARTDISSEALIYASIEKRTLEILEWAKRTQNARNTGLPMEQWRHEVQHGNALLENLHREMAQLRNEHQYFINELKRQSDHVRKSSFLTIALGTLGSLAIFLAVMLRVNQLIIERQRARNELIENEQRYRTLADTGQALIWTAGTDMLCNYFNKVWLDFTGRSIEQEIGNGWTEGVHPDDFQRCVDTYIQAFEKREKFSMDYRLRRHDGEYRWIQDDGTPRYDAKADFVGYIGYCLDITERKLAREALEESELRFRNLLGEISSVAVQGYAPNLTTIYWNKASEKLYGYSAEEAIGKKLTDLIIPREMTEGVQHAVAQMIASGQGNPTEELSLQHKDGSRVEVISSHAIVSIPGKPAQLFCVDIDISQRKQIELELQTYRNHLEELVEIRTLELAHAKDAAESANRAKSSFLANMSHEIRTPMNAIIGFTHLLRRDSSNEKTSSKLDKISNAAQHLLNILNDILDLSKIEANRLTLEEKEFSPASVVENTLALLKDRARAKGLQLTASIAPRVPTHLLGDPLRISQIVLNIVGNAIKFADRGEVSVRLLLAEEDSASVLLRMEIRDEGIGLSAEQQEQIFLPFVQADGSTTRKYGGTGLGLAICRLLAQAMGGNIGVESQLGQGSLFWVTVRLCKGGSPSEATNNAENITSAHLPLEDRIRAQFKGTKILLAEDDLISSEVALELLHLAGLNVDTASNGQEAITRAKRTDYAIILMDMQMPIMSGVDATKAIRELPDRESRPYILAMTANAFEEDRQACLDAGMNDYIAKPVEPDELYTTLLRWLQRCKEP